MLEWLLDSIVTENRWLAISMVVGGAVVAGTLWPTRGRGTDRGVVLAALNLFYGVMIGIMGVGHFLAISVHLARGERLRMSALALYAIGVVIVLPAAALVVHAWRSRRRPEPVTRFTYGINAFMGLSLLALGVHNAPLAAPALLNVAFARARRPTVAWAIAGLTVAGYAALFIGAVVFFTSGQSFEQFTGLEP